MFSYTFFILFIIIFLFQAGPTVCQALHDFLVRLEMMCDVITTDSCLGNSLKDLLLKVIYQLVQPSGPLILRKGPLDAQCKLITSVINLNYVNTDLGIAMSISECVGVLVSTYVKGSEGKVFFLSNIFIINKINNRD